MTEVYTVTIGDFTVTIPFLPPAYDTYATNTLNKDNALQHGGISRLISVMEQTLGHVNTVNTTATAASNATEGTTTNGIILFGIETSIPASGVGGRLYFTTDIGAAHKIYLDVGHPGTPGDTSSWFIVL